MVSWWQASHDESRLNAFQFLLIFYLFIEKCLMILFRNINYYYYFRTYLCIHVNWCYVLLLAAFFIFTPSGISLISVEWNYLLHKYRRFRLLWSLFAHLRQMDMCQFIGMIPMESEYSFCVLLKKIHTHTPIIYDDIPKLSALLEMVFEQAKSPKSLVFDREIHCASFHSKSFQIFNPLRKK